MIGERRSAHSSPLRPTLARLSSNSRYSDRSLVLEM